MSIFLPLSLSIILSLKRKWRLPAACIFTIVKIGDSGTLIHFSTRLFKQTNKQTKFHWQLLYHCPCLYDFVPKEKIEAACCTHLHNGLFFYFWGQWWFRDTLPSFYEVVQTNKQNFIGYLPTTVPVWMILSLKRRWRLPSAHIVTMASSSIFDDDVYVSASSSSLVIGATLVCSNGNSLHNCENWWFRVTHPSFYEAVETNKENFIGFFPTTVPVFMILSLKRRWRLPAARIFTMVSSSIFEDDVYVSASSSSLVIGATLVCSDGNGLSSGRRRPQ